MSIWKRERGCKIQLYANDRFTLFNNNALARYLTDSKLIWFLPRLSVVSVYDDDDDEQYKIEISFKSMKSILPD